MATRWISAWLCLTVLSLFGAPFSPLTFESARKQAGQTGKLVLVDFYTTWCGPCKMLDKNTWTDPQVITLLQSNAVALRLDAEKETDLAKRYQIHAYPSVLLLKPDGTEIDRLVGYRDPKTFIADFKAALSGKDSVARAKEALLASGTNDASARLLYGRALAQQGKDAQALEEYLWCFDQGLADPAFAGVRLSFLLNDIKSLGNRYPAAKQALESRRDERQAKVLAGSADRQVVLDLVRLNETLGQKQNNLEVFDHLPAASPVRQQVANLMVDQLLVAKRYGDVLAGQDARAIFGAQVNGFNRLVGSLPESNPMKKEMEDSLRSHAVSTGANYFEALAGLKRNQDAKALAQDILKFSPSAETHTTLAKAARRAGNTELAQEVTEKH